MGSPLLVLLEGILVFGGLIAFAVWQLVSLNRPSGPPRPPDRDEDPPDRSVK